jgi:hypothetical protein
MVVKPNANLLQVIRAAGATSRLASGLDRGQKQSHKDADDGDYDQQFHQGETWPL